MPIQTICPRVPAQAMPNAAVGRREEAGQRMIPEEVGRGWLSDGTALPERDVVMPLPGSPNGSRHRDANRELQLRGPARRLGDPPWAAAGAAMHLAPSGRSDPSPAA